MKYGDEVIEFVSPFIVIEAGSFDHNRVEPPPC